MNLLTRRAVVIGLALIAAGCWGGGNKYTYWDVPFEGNEQVGVASWYGGKYHGRHTASGEKYNMRAMTAAHKTLPFGTRVRVYNLDNGKSTVVRINDRGPFVGGRIIDLSRAAAKEIGMVEAGLANVRIVII